MTGYSFYLTVISITFIYDGTPICPGMSDRTILITGSTDGIGKATATALAGLGVHVLVHGRNNEKGKRVMREMKDKTGNDRIDLFIADLASQREVRRLAKAVQERFDRLDVLINNAGTFERSRRRTEDGIETTFAVNYLAPFLLTRLLEPLLRQSAPARVVNLASIAHFDTKTIDWGNLQGERSYDPYEAYSLSKYAVITFTYILAEKLEGSGVTANCLHPGVINTKMLREGFPGYHGDPPETGARTPVYLATSPEVEGVTGKYFDNMRPARSSKLTHDRGVQERLWKVAKDLTGV